MTVGSVGGTYGLSGSGIDVDSIVKSLMTGQQAKADALLQKKTVLQWQKTAYNTVYDDISNFRTTVFNYKLQGTLSPNKVSSSNTSVATVTANADAVDVNHSLVVAQLASGVNLTSTAPISIGDKSTLASQMGVAGSFTIKISDGVTTKSIDITSTESINQVVSDINNAGINVKANYDSNTDRFFLTTTNTGTSSGISFAGSDQDGLNFLGGKLKLSKGTTETTLGSGIYTSAPEPGLNAEFQLDGVNFSQASNAFTISGVNCNLTGVSTGTPLTPTNISVTNDTDTAVASIKSLVDSYNKILAEVNGKMNETRYKDFPPLTDAQKTAMKEADITAWETKAKSGMLHNDPTLASLVNNMRNAFSNPVSGITGPYNSAASIGIKTGSDYTEGGKLYLDTDKLRTALNANPNVLNQLFGASGTDSQSQGISGRLYDGIKTTMDQLAQTAGTTGTAQYDTKSSFAKRITSYNLQISDQADRFSTIEKAYYKKFNAMEVALKQLNSQSSWLSSQLSSSTGG